MSSTYLSIIVYQSSRFDLTFKTSGNQKLNVYHISSLATDNVLQVKNCKVVYTEIRTLGHFRNPRRFNKFNNRKASATGRLVAKVFRLLNLLIRFSTRAAWACEGCWLWLYPWKLRDVAYGFKNRRSLAPPQTSLWRPSLRFNTAYFRCVDHKKFEMIIHCHIFTDVPPCQLESWMRIGISVGVCREQCHLKIQIYMRHQHTIVLVAGLWDEISICPIRVDATWPLNVS